MLRNNYLLKMIFLIDLFMMLFHSIQNLLIIKFLINNQEKILKRHRIYQKS